MHKHMLYDWSALHIHLHVKVDMYVFFFFQGWHTYTFYNMWIWQLQLLNYKIIYMIMMNIFDDRDILGKLCTISSNHNFLKVYFWNVFLTNIKFCIRRWLDFLLGRLWFRILRDYFSLPWFENTQRYLYPNIFFSMKVWLNFHCFMFV